MVIGSFLVLRVLANCILVDPLGCFTGCYAIQVCFGACV